MTTFTIRTPDDSMRFQHFLSGMEFPYVVTAKKDRDRTAAQNRLIHKWFGEIAAQKGDVTAQEVKAACNLAYGKPILMRDDPEWAEAFGRLFDVLNHEAKMDAIRILDLPFTRRMGVGQLSEYMDAMMRDALKRGVVLTDPEGLAK